MLYNSEVKRLVRIGIFIFLSTVFIAAILHFVTQAEVFNSVYTVLAAILSILVVPPFARYLQDAFNFREDVEDIIRQQLKTVWIEGYLRTEERAIISSSVIDPVLAEELRCDMPVHYKGYNHITLNLPFDEKKKLFQFLPNTKKNDESNSDNENHYTIATNDNESLITIFNQFTQLVREDDNVTGEFIVILGNRGTRKTLQLLKLAEYLVDRDKRVPIYLNLFSWAAGSKRFDLWLIEEIASQYDVLSEQAKQLIESKYLILLLDGFEEVPHDRRFHLVQSLTEFLQVRIQRSEQNRNRSTQSNRNGNGNGNGNGNSPIDLRDAVVLGSLFPVQWMKGNEEKNHLNHRANSNYYLKESPYENFLDLHHHIQALVQQLEQIENNIEVSHKAPVVVLKVKKAKKQDVLDYMRCHFERKVIQAQLLYEGVPNLATLEKRESLYRRNKLKYRAERLAKERLEELKDNRLYDTLMSVLGRSPFLLRVFISTYTCTPNADLDKCDLQSDVISNGTSMSSNMSFQEMRHHAREDFSELHKNFIIFANIIDAQDSIKSLRDSIVKVIPLDESTLNHNDGFTELYDQLLNIAQIAGIDTPSTVPKLQNDIKKLWDITQQVINSDTSLTVEYDTDVKKIEKYLATKLPPSENFVYDQETSSLSSDDLKSIAKCLQRLYHREVFKLEDKVRKVIIHHFIEDGLRNQPSNVGPLGEISRYQVLHWIATGMSERKQRVLDRGDVVFYLEDVGQQYVFATDDKEEGEKKRKEYHGYVAFTSVLLFFMIYGTYLLILLALTNSLQAEPFSPSIIGVVGILLLLFARSFGLHSNSSTNDETEDRTQLSYPVRWYGSAGASSGLFMGIIVSLIFFGVSQVIYGNISREPLRFEAAIVGLFAFALFYLLGGLELGRRYAIVARPEDGRRFLLITTIIASIAWLAFFFLFLFWPRTRFDLLTQAQIIEILPLAGLYSLATSLFIGIISALVFSHLYLRHLVLFRYLRRNNKLQITYQQVLRQNVDAGFLRQVGGGYIFRHRLIMDYFSKLDREANNVSTS
ncbi:MAG: hypothetical protein AAF846_16855 [Chloroflexota bacterium]